MWRFIVCDALTLNEIDHLAAAFERRHRRQELALAVEHADPGRSVELVAGESVKIRVDRLHIDVAVDGGLATIEQHLHAFGVRDARDLPSRRFGAEHVRHVRDRDKFRFRTYQRIQRVKINAAIVIDIEPAEQTLRALKALPLTDYRFSVITYETDVYVAGDGPQKEAFEILSDFGYTRVVKNVAFQGNPFEDWYVDRDFVDTHAMSLIMDNSDEPKEASRIISKLT